MIVAREVRQSYRAWEPSIREVFELVQETLQRLCDELGLELFGRTKTLDSVAEKIESGRYSSWQELDDLVAFSVVVASLEEEETVIERLGDAFQKQAIKGRGKALKRPESFRFDTTRFYGRLPLRPGDELSVDPSRFGVTFEVQIPRWFEYAWSRTTHSLTYKADEIAWERLRLAAHVRASAEQLDGLVHGFSTFAPTVGGGECAWVTDQAEIRDCFVDLDEKGHVPGELRPKVWSRFCQNLYSMVQALSGERPYPKEKKRVKRLEEALELLKSYFEENANGSIPRSVSLFQLCFGILVEAGFGSPVGSFVGPVTEELEALFPRANFGGVRFRH